jgi:hypothetical protein
MTQKHCAIRPHVAAGLGFRQGQAIKPPAKETKDGIRTEARANQVEGSGRATISPRTRCRRAPSFATPPRARRVMPMATAECTTTARRSNKLRHRRRRRLSVLCLMVRHAENKGFPHVSLHAYPSPGRLLTHRHVGPSGRLQRHIPALHRHPFRLTGISGGFSRPNLT